MSQRDLAAALGKPPSWIAKVEQGERRLDLIEFIAIAWALGVDEGGLFRRVVGSLPKRLDS